MNETAKKLREAADYVSDNTATLVQVISQVREKLDVEETDTFGGDLVAVLDVIADELDELQARAAVANNLRQQLESAEDKAERRKKHIGYLETALHDKNALLEQRGGTIARLTAECSELRKQVPSERERQILDLWPKWSNGDYCMFGDLWTAQPYWEREPNQLTRLSILSPKLLEEWDQAQGENFAYEWNFLRPADTTYRPEKAEPSAPKVLDADGVEIHVGDTVWHCNGIASGVITSIDAGSLMNTIRYVDESGTEFCDAARNLTHTRPDSWERLEMDAELNDETGIVGGNLDIVRRAKALAGVEVD